MAAEIEIPYMTWGGSPHRVTAASDSLPTGTRRALHKWGEFLAETGDYFDFISHGGIAWIEDSTSLEMRLLIRPFVEDPGGKRPCWWFTGFLLTSPYHDEPLSYSFLFDMLEGLTLEEVRTGHAPLRFAVPPKTLLAADGTYPDGKTWRADPRQLAAWLDAAAAGKGRALPKRLTIALNPPRTDERMDFLLLTPDFPFRGLCLAPDRGGSRKDPAVPAPAAASTAATPERYSPRVAGRLRFCLIVSVLVGLLVLGTVKLGLHNRVRDPDSSSRPHSLNRSHDTSPEPHRSDRKRDFDHVVAQGFSECELGHRLTAAPGRFAFAVRKLDKSTTAKVKLKARMRPFSVDSSDDRDENAYIVFGDEPRYDRLIKVGFTFNRGQAVIITRPTDDCPAATVRVPTESRRTPQLSVVVDMSERTVTVLIDRSRASVPLPDRIEVISYVGYAVDNAISEFSRLEIEQQ